jgi:hypothetical protein
MLSAQVTSFASMTVPSVLMVHGPVYFTGVIPAGTPVQFASGKAG